MSPSISLPVFHKKWPLCPDSHSSDSLVSLVILGSLHYTAMLAPSRKRPLPLLIALALTLLLFTYTRDADHIYRQWTSSLNTQHSNTPANRTLGFGAAIVVSKDGSERRHSLLQAANVTDIDLTIPQQPMWTDDDIEAFRNGQEDKVQVGSLLAWLGHRNALKW